MFFLLLFYVKSPGKYLKGFKWGWTLQREMLRETVHSQFYNLTDSVWMLCGQQFAVEAGKSVRSCVMIQVRDKGVGVD